VVGSPLYIRDSIAYKDVLRFLADNEGQGYEVVNLHGGEPTVHPRFIETLELIRRLGYAEVHLQTNGITLADPDFASQLVPLGVKLFIVSLHGDTADTQDSQTCSVGGFERTISGIRNVKALGARVRTNTVITRQNITGLSRIAQLACDLGVDQLNFSNLHPVGSAIFGLGRILPTFEDIRAHLYPAIDLALRAERRVTLEGFPYCVIPEQSKLHLGNTYRAIRMLMRGKIIDNYDDFMNDSCRVHGVPCEGCSMRDQCGGVYPEYIDFRGWDEFHPFESNTNVSSRLPACP